jgi:hypothetical protein
MKASMPLRMARWCVRSSPFRAWGRFPVRAFAGSGFAVCPCNRQRNQPTPENMSWTPTECPLWVISRLFSTTSKMSAFGGKADIYRPLRKSPLIAISGHYDYGGLHRSPHQKRTARRSRLINLTLSAKGKQIPRRLDCGMNPTKLDGIWAMSVKVFRPIPSHITE